jgi:hypothetical protein
VHVLQLAALEEVAQLAVGAIPRFARFSIGLRLARRLQLVVVPVRTRRGGWIR